MKNIIVYFSSTGNSFYAAKFLSKHLSDCTCISFAGMDLSTEIGDADTNIGFVFPTYFFSIPRFFAEAIGRLKLNNKAYYYGITTCNGFSGNTGHQLKTILESQGCHLSFFHVLKMPGNYIMEYGPPKEDVINRKIADSETKLSDIATAIAARKQILIKKKHFLASNVFRKFMYRKQHKWHQDFYVNDKCASCGLCQKICQFNNINLQDGKPRWDSNCEHCVACIQLCPSQAIEFANRTRRRKRYKNPKVPFKDLLEENRP